MVDHQIHGDQRIGEFGVLAKLQEGVAHRCQIDHARHAGEVLQQHAGRHELNFFLRSARVPPGDVFDVALFHRYAVFVPQKVFEQDLDGIGDALEIEARRGERGETVYAVFSAVYAQRGEGTKGIAQVHGFTAIIVAWRGEVPVRKRHSLFTGVPAWLGIAGRAFRDGRGA